MIVTFEISYLDLTKLDDIDTKVANQLQKDIDEYIMKQLLEIHGKK